MERPFKNPSVIPESWYQYNRHDVNTATRKNAIQVGMDKWVTWEKDTKKLYENLYRELVILNEIASAQEISKYIEDVDNELADACQKYIELSAIDYDISDIIMEQKELKELYEIKLKEIEL